MRETLRACACRAREQQLILDGHAPQQRAVRRAAAFRVGQYFSHLQPALGPADERACRAIPRRVDRRESADMSERTNADQMLIHGGTVSCGDAASTIRLAACYYSRCRDAVCLGNDGSRSGGTRRTSTHPTKTMKSNEDQAESRTDL